MWISGLPSGFESGLILFRRSDERALRGASAVASGDPDRLVGGLLDLTLARLESRTANKLVHVADESFRSVLDILA